MVILAAANWFMLREREGTNGGEVEQKGRSVGGKSWGRV